MFLPLSENLNIKGRALPVTEWMLIDQGGGAIESLLINHNSNQRQILVYFTPERGAQCSYEVDPTALDGKHIQTGDTLSHLHVSSLDQQVIALKGNIQELRASLEFLRSGDRETEIEGSRQRLEYSKTRHAEQVKVLKRTEDLLSRGIISQQEYDLEARRERLDAIRVSIDEADLGSAMSGAQSSKLEIIQAQIDENSLQLTLLEDLINNLIFTSPIDGNLFYPTNQDTLLSVANTDTLVIFTLVSIQQLSSLDVIQEVSIQSGGESYPINLDNLSQVDQYFPLGDVNISIYRAIIPNLTGLFRRGQTLDISLKMVSRTGLEKIYDWMENR